ncbi:vWA domain-containing protein [Planctomycetes bacterium CA13]
MTRDSLESKLSDAKASLDAGVGDGLQSGSSEERMQSILDERSALELELVRVRRAGDAARLDAQAAELELRIRTLTTRIAAKDSSVRLDPKVRAEIQNDAFTALRIDSAHGQTGAPRRFSDWDELRTLQQRLAETQQRTSEFQAEVGSDVGIQERVTRFDSSQPSVASPHFAAFESTDSPSIATSAQDGPVNDGPVNDGPVNDGPVNDGPVNDGPEVHDQLSVATKESCEEPSETPADETPDEREPAFELFAPRTVPEEVGEVELAVPEENAENDDRPKRRPAAWIASAIVHVGILLVLGLITLQTQSPRDQVALSASATSESDMSMETFSIESTEPETEQTEPTESVVENELTPLGEVVVAYADTAASNPPPSPLSSMMRKSSDAASTLMSKPSNSDAKMQFCGVDGGGNHFVYLVDSSQSMGDAFQSARLELLRSINQLKPDQKFYVIFYDSNPDYMRLSSPDKDEQRSVYATPQNKAALQRWAMSIKPNRGKNPNVLLEFALQLKADAIFLLSDGEFPQSTEDLLKERNRKRNLFGEGGIISIIHTIAYYSRDGETRMKRIAAQNQGQYRYIAKP